MRAVHFAVEKIVEPVRAAGAGRCLPSGPTARRSGSRREQPGEEQEAPFSDHLVHCGPQMVPKAMLERFRRGLAVNPGGQRLVGDGD